MKYMPSKQLIIFFLRKFEIVLVLVLVLDFLDFFIVYTIFFQMRLVEIPDHMQSDVSNLHIHWGS